MLEVPSAEDNAIDGPLVSHLDSPPSVTGNCTKRGLCWATADHALGLHLCFLFTDRFSRRADMFAVTTAEYAAEGTANSLINRGIPLWGCPRSILSDNGLPFRSRLSHVTYELVGVRKIATSSYHPSGCGGVEGVNHTMAQLLAMVVTEFQDEWDSQLLHVKFACNNSVGAATDLASNDVHMGKLPRLALTNFDRSGVAGYQSLARDHLAYCDLASERQCMP